jgi:hypothetical protein
MGTIHQKDMTTINIYALNIQYAYIQTYMHTQLHKTNTLGIEAQIDPDTIIGVEPNTPLSPRDMTREQKERN